jgi:hypothetical protein
MVSESDGKKKGGYRVDLFKQLINSYPRGAHIPSPELVAALHLDNRNALYGIVHRLNVKGHIVVHNKRSATNNWYEIVKPPKIYATTSEVVVPEVSIPETAELPKTSLDTSGIERLAMEYAWTYPEGTLRQFIYWVKEREE